MPAKFWSTWIQWKAQHYWFMTYSISVGQAWHLVDSWCENMILTWWIWTCGHTLSVQLQIRCRACPHAGSRSCWNANIMNLLHVAQWRQQWWLAPKHTFGVCHLWPGTFPHVDMRKLGGSLRWRMTRMRIQVHHVYRKLNSRSLSPYWC